jgi:hypothetical protein
MAVIPALGSLKQEGHDFEASLGYISETLAQNAKTVDTAMIEACLVFTRSWFDPNTTKKKKKEIHIYSLCLDNRLNVTCNY